MRGLQCISGVAMSVLSLLAGVAQAQVDWSDVLNGKPAQPVVEAPGPPEAAPPPAPPPAQHRARTREPTRAHSKPASVTQGAGTRAHRAVAMPPEDDREYPAVPTGRRR